MLVLFEYIIVVLLGLSFGSFANVLINRLPLGVSIVTPSQCPQCNTNIKYYDNIPVFAYFFLLGQSRCCNKKISIQYPIIEIVATSIALLSFSYSGFSFDTVFIFLLSLVLIILFMTDKKEYVLPNSITYPTAAIGLVLSILNVNPFETLFLDSLLGGCISGLFFLSISKLYLYLKDREGLGLGDVKMISMLGFWLGIESILFIIIVSSLLGIFIGVGLIISHKIKAQEYLPYGCFISIAALIVILLKLKLNFSFINFIT